MHLSVSHHQQNRKPYVLAVGRPGPVATPQVLRLAGLVQERRVGTHANNSLDPSGLEAVRSYFDSFWQRSLTAFKAAVEQSSPPEHHAAEEAP